MKWTKRCALIYLLLMMCSATQAAPFLVEDICPGSDKSEPEGFIPLNGKLLFHLDANCDSAEYGLYISDGTRVGTRKIHDVSMRGADSNKADWLVVGNKLYFAGSLSSLRNGVELWVTDGTTAGTRMIKDIIPGGTFSDSDPSEFTRMNGIIYFIAEAVGYDSGLYRTNGTAAGTWLVKGFSNDISGLSVAGSRVLFELHPNQLWFSNGSRAGTQKIKSYKVLEDLVSLNGSVVLFNALEYGKEYITERLARSDGTVAGTYLLSNVEDCQLSWFRQFDHYPGNVLYFQSSCVRDLGDSLWKTNGTNSGTVRIKNIKNLWTFFLPDGGSHGGSSKKVGFGTAYYNNEFYFIGSDNRWGYEVWKTNGTAAGTKRITNICPGNRPKLTQHPKILGTHSDGVYFVSKGCPFSDRTLWVTKGTPGTTHTVLRGTGVSLPRFSTDEEVRSAGSFLYFRGKAIKSGEELFIFASEDPNKGLGFMPPMFQLLLLDE